MEEEFQPRLSLMASLTFSALDKAARDPNCWREPEVHEAILISGLSVLVAATQILDKDLGLL